MNLFTLCEPKELKTSVPLVFSNECSLLISVLKMLWLVPHDYIREAWSFEWFHRWCNCTNMILLSRWTENSGKLYSYFTHGSWEVMSKNCVQFPCMYDLLQSDRKHEKTCSNENQNLPHQDYNTSLCIQRQRERHQCRTLAHLEWLTQYPDPVKKS